MPAPNGSKDTSGGRRRFAMFKMLELLFNHTGGGGVVLTILGIFILVGVLVGYISKVKGWDAG